MEVRSKLKITWCTRPKVAKKPAQLLEVITHPWTWMNLHGYKQTIGILRFMYQSILFHYAWRAHMNDPRKLINQPIFTNDAKLKWSLRRNSSSSNVNCRPICQGHLNIEDKKVWIKRRISSGQKYKFCILL